MRVRSQPEHPAEASDRPHDTGVDAIAMESKLTDYRPTGILFGAAFYDEYRVNG